MPYTLNGIGTTYYGSRDKGADGFYTTTKFFVLFAIPIVPLGSWRVRPVGRQTGIFTRTQNYEVIPQPMHWGQVLNVYATCVGIAAAAVAAFYLFGGRR